jgi:hypothetical protein
MSRRMVLSGAALVAPLFLFAAAAPGSFNGPQEVSSTVSSRLYGGCNSAIEKECSGTLKGCENTEVDYITTGSGSWKEKADKYCGVKECGNYSESEKCDG